MSKSYIAVSVEEAIAALVNMDYIPKGLSLLDMTGAFLEEAEAEYEKAVIEGQISSLDRLRLRIEACQHRHSLAGLLLTDLQNEINNPEGSVFVMNENGGEIPILDWTEVSYWAADKYGIGAQPPQSKETIKKFSWNEVTIRMYAGFKVRCYVEGEEVKRSSFESIGLIDKRAKVPNHQGGILIGFSQGEQFPPGETLKGKDKTAISKLRTALKKLLTISEDPFQEFNSGEGWKPRFKIVSKINCADERAKRDAMKKKHYDTNDYEVENDVAQKWMDENNHQ